MKRVRKIPIKQVSLTAPRMPQRRPKAAVTPIASPAPAPVTPIASAAPNGLITHGHSTVSAVMAFEAGPGAVRNASVEAHEAKAQALAVQTFNRRMGGGQ
jgi:hypothetical protein